MDILPKPSQGKNGLSVNNVHACHNKMLHQYNTTGVLKYSRMERTTFPLFLLSNWQHGAITGQGNTFVVSGVAQTLITYLTDKEDIALLLAGLPIESNLSTVLLLKHLTHKHIHI